MKTNELLKISQPKAIVIVVCFFIFTLLALYYTINNLGIDTNTENMIAKESNWRKVQLKDKKIFPANHDNIIITVKTNSKEQQERVSQALVTKLEQLPELSDIYSTHTNDFLAKNYLLYASIPDIKNLLALNKIKPILKQLTDTQTTENFFKVLLDTKQQQEFNDIRARLYKQLTLFFNEKSLHSTLSWSSVLSNTEKTSFSNMIIVKPRLNYKTLFPAAEIISKINTAIAKIKNTPEFSNTKIELTGKVVLSHDELKTVSNGTIGAMIISFFLVGCILIFSLKSISLVIIALYTLVTGLILTACFASVFIGHLNMISVAFAVLYIGLGVDFSIHLLTRYKYLSQEQSKQQALIATIKQIAPSLGICAITTSIGFFSFIPTSFTGVAELGIISGAGMLISLILNVTLLPALITLLPIKPYKIERKYDFAEKIKDFNNNKRNNIAVTAGSFFLILLIIPSLDKLKFVADPIKLQDQSIASVVAYNDLVAANNDLMSASIIVNSKQQINAVTQNLQGSKLIKDILTLDNFVPDNQSKKLSLIKQLSFTNDLKINTKQYNHTASYDIESSIIALTNFSNNLNQDHTELKTAIDSYLSYLNTKNANEQVDLIINLERYLYKYLNYNLQKIHNHNKTEIITIENLPVELTKRWQQGNNYKIQILSNKNLTIRENEIEFAKEIISLTPNATGLPIIHLQAGNEVINAFKKAFIISTCFIILISWIYFKKAIYTCFVLTPLYLGSILTAVAAIVLNIPFNFANIIALPLLLGVGIDNGIHMVHNYLEQKNGRINQYQNSTTRAIITSTLTTITSFGALIFSSHLGMSGMGKLLTAGMIMMLIATIFLLPALLNLHNKK